MKTIILGLGNPSFGDDGVGALVARALRLRVASSNVQVEEAAVAGLDVLDIVAGFDRAIIVDAVQSPGGRPGSIYRIDSSQPSHLPESTPHQVDFLAALEMGRCLELDLPKEVITFAIEAGNIAEVTDGCTPEVEAAIPGCLALIIQELKAEHGVVQAKI
jgi:hydrogenase maturation protease